MQCLHSLRIKLFVVRRRINVNGPGKLHAEESSATRWVSQHIGLIGRGDERGTTREVLYVTSVWSLDLYRRQRDDILQESLLCLGRYLVELIKVDEQHLCHLLQHLLLVVYLQVTRIAEAEFRRQQLFAEGALVVSLCRNQ